SWPKLNTDAVEPFAFWPESWIITCGEAPPSVRWLVFAKSNVPEGRLTASPALAWPTNRRPTVALKLSRPEGSRVDLWPSVPEFPWRTTRLPVPLTVSVPPVPLIVTGTRVEADVPALVLLTTSGSPVVVLFSVSVWPELTVVVWSD